MSAINGKKMISWMKDLWSYPRSITGHGTRATLEYLKNINQDLIIYSFKSGEKVFDWTIPDEWNIYDAYMEHESGKIFAEFSRSNLHILGYSIPCDASYTLSELLPHIFTQPDQPSVIPYVTSYYKENWGFCMSDNDKSNLPNGNYHIVIDSKKSPGTLELADLVIKGESSKEIFFSTYICHPSMANNELSGPVLTMAIARHLSSLDLDNRYTYRILFLPETIGAISYLSQNLHKMKNNTIAGFVISCVGDQRDFSIIQSRSGKCLSDRVLIHTLKQYCEKPTTYSFLDRGSDERQYCSPGVDLPVSGFSRSKYATFPEYHTSFDDLSLITQRGLEESYSVMIDVLRILENNHKYKTSILCEPQLGRRGLYHKIGVENTGISHKKSSVNLMMDFIAFADGYSDIISIAEKIGCRATDLIDIAKLLWDHNIISIPKLEIE